MIDLQIPPHSKDSSKFESSEVRFPSSRCSTSTAPLLLASFNSSAKHSNQFTFFGLTCRRLFPTSKLLRPRQERACCPVLKVRSKVELLVNLHLWFVRTRALKQYINALSCTLISMLVYKYACSIYVL